MTEFVPLTSLASEAGMHPLSMKKSVLRAGFAPQWVRMNGRKLYALPRAEADDYLAQRNTVGVVPRQLAIGDNVGGIYLIRPEPSLRPNRLKIGKAVSFDNRIKAHRCIAPELEILALWPTLAAWMESMALGLLSNRDDVTFASPEVFDTDNVEEICSLLKEAFAKQGVHGGLKEGFYDV